MPEKLGLPEPSPASASTDRVVIVGAGPVGCVSALLLAGRGVPVTLLERHPAPHPLPRAVHLDDEAARILHAVGVGADFLARSRPGSGLRLLDAQHQVLAEFGRRPQAGRHGFPPANMFHQPELEDLLFARVETHPLIDFRRNLDVVALDGALDPFDAAPVQVVGRPVDGGDRQAFTGRVVLGCDGANSVVRDLIGVTMTDLGFTERWLVVDIRSDRDLDTWDGVEQVCDPARAATFMQVVGDRYRWEFQLHDGEEEADLTTPEALARLLRPWTGQETLDGLEVVRAATYTFRARVASRFSAGRVFLLGDAAHLTPPFIGQGLGAGLRDCDNLTWKITHVLTGQAGPSLLETYDAERRPHATALVRKAVRVGWAMTGGQDRAAAVRRIVASVVCRSRTVRDVLADPTTPRLKRGAMQGTVASVIDELKAGTLRVGTLRAGVLRLDAPKVGGLLGDPRIHLAGAADGGPAVRLGDLLGRRVAVLTARSPEPDLVELCRRYGMLLVRLGGEPRPVEVSDRGWTDVQPADADDATLTALLDDPELAVLVRPDRVVAALARRPHPLTVPWAARPVAATVPTPA